MYSKYLLAIFLLIYIASCNKNSNIKKSPEQSSIVTSIENEDEEDDNSYDEVYTNKSKEKLLLKYNNSRKEMMVKYRGETIFLIPKNFTTDSDNVFVNDFYDLIKNGNRLELLKANKTIFINYDTLQ